MLAKRGARFWQYILFTIKGIPIIATGDLEGKIFRVE